MITGAPVHRASRVDVQIPLTTLLNLLKSEMGLASLRIDQPSVFRWAA